MRLEENDYCTISVRGGGRHWEGAGKKGKLKLGRAPGRVVKGDPVSCSNFKNHTPQCHISQATNLKGKTFLAFL